MNMQQTVIGVKPDVFQQGEDRERGSELKLELPKNPQDFIDELKKEISQRGLRIIEEHTKICTEELARKHYAEFADSFSEEFQENKQDFLARFMTSGKSHWMLCEGTDAVLEGRSAIKHMREKYLLAPKEARYNMTHGSGNIEEANAEVKLHFNK